MKYYPVIRIFIVMFITAAVALFFASEGGVPVFEESLQRLIQVVDVESSSNPRF